MRCTAPQFRRARGPLSHRRASPSFVANRTLESVRVKLVERFGQIAAERLEATSGLTVDAMSTGLWRERRLALHLSTIIAVLALFVVLSNSLDMIRKLALTRMSEATFVTAFYFAFDTALGVMFYWLIRTLNEPPRALGLNLIRWPRQVAAGLAWSLPALAGAAAIRGWLHPDEPVLSVYALTGGHHLIPDGAAPTAVMVGYVLYLCPVQEYIARAGVQAPIMNAFGVRLAGVGAVGVDARRRRPCSGPCISCSAWRLFCSPRLSGSIGGSYSSEPAACWPSRCRTWSSGSPPFYWFGLIR